MGPGEGRWNGEFPSRKARGRRNGGSPAAEWAETGTQTIVLRGEEDPGVLEKRKATTTLWVSISTSVKWVDSVSFSSFNTVFDNLSFILYDVLGPDLARI